MNSYFALYLLTRLDAIQGVLAAISIIGFMAFAAVIIQNIVDDDNDIYNRTGEDLENWKKKRSDRVKKVKWVIPVAIICGILAVLTPNKREAIFIIAGGKTIEWAASDSSLSKIPSQTTAIISEYLDKQLRKLESLTEKE